MTVGASTVITWLLCAAGGFSISGVVVDAAGAPVPDADVWFWQDRQVSRVETNAEGAFRFDDAGVGPTEVVARKEGYALGGLQGEAAGPASITVQLRNPASIRLRIVDPHLHPIEGARIKAMRVSGRFSVAVEDLVKYGFPSLRSDEEGLLVMEEAPEDGYASFLVAHQDYVDKQVPPLPVGSELNVVLVEGVPVHGRVVSETGDAIGRARVSVFQVNRDGQRKTGEVLSDAEGYYRVRVPPGAYMVAAKHPDYASPLPFAIEPKAAPAENLVDIVMPKPLMIEGRVVGPDDKPLGGVRVYYGLEGHVLAGSLTGPDGAFMLQALEKPGFVRVAPPDGWMAEKHPEIAVDPAGAERMRLAPIRLQPLPEIRGTVFMPDREPAGDVLVWTVDGGAGLWAITDEDGTFSMQLARAPDEAKVALEAEHALRFLRAESRVSLRDAEPAEMRLALFEPDLHACEPDRAPNDLSALAGARAPEISCSAWFNSDGFSIADAHGKVVVLTFWGAFWGRQVLGRVDALVALHRLLGKVDDVVIVGVHDALSDADEVQDFVEGLGIAFPVCRDTDAAETFDAYKVRTVPQTVLIDKRGTLRYYEVEGRLLELIKSLRREP